MGLRKPVQVAPPPPSPPPHWRIRSDTLSYKEREIIALERIAAALEKLADNAVERRSPT